MTALTSIFFFFNDTATTEIYTLSLHDALPISGSPDRRCRRGSWRPARRSRRRRPSSAYRQDRKSTRLNSSHSSISYAVFCLKKKIHNTQHLQQWPHFSYSSTLFSPSDVH